MTTAEVWEWLPAGGGSYRLDSAIDGVYVVESVTGRFMPPIRRTTEIVPLQPGNRPRSIVHDAVEVTIGLLFSGVTPVALRDTLRAWMARFDPTRGQGRLRVTGPNATVRELTCAYQDGLELQEDAAMRQDQPAVVTFEAADPYWADIDDTTATFIAGAPATFFPFFPLNLGASQVFGLSTVTNPGDVDTYPVWTITGPGSLLVVTNVTTGRTLQWDGALGAGEVLTIDCRGGNQSFAPKSVLKNDGSNQFGLLSQLDFWPLAPGDNQLDVEFSGVTGASGIGLSFRSRYLGA